MNVRIRITSGVSQLGSNVAVAASSVVAIVATTIDRTAKYLRTTIPFLTIFKFPLSERRMHRWSRTNDRKEEKWWDVLAKFRACISFGVTTIISFQLVITNTLYIYITVFIINHRKIHRPHRRNKKTSKRHNSSRAHIRILFYHYSITSFLSIFKAFTFSILLTWFYVELISLMLFNL